MELRVLSAISLVLTIFLSCSQREHKRRTFYNSNNLQLENDNGIAKINGKLFTGTIFTLYPSSKDTAEIYSFKKGKEDGEWKFFYPQNKLKQQRFYQNGVKIKTMKEWWDNGKIKLLTSFLNGEYHGETKEWNRDGQLVKEMHYKLGYEEGSQKQFYDNGKIRSNYIIKNGKRYGLLGTKNCVNVSDSVFSR